MAYWHFQETRPCMIHFSFSIVISANETPQKSMWRKPENAHAIKTHREKPLVLEFIYCTFFLDLNSVKDQTDRLFSSVFSLQASVCFLFTVSMKKLIDCVSWQQVSSQPFQGAQEPKGAQVATKNWRKMQDIYEMLLWGWLGWRGS